MSLHECPAFNLRITAAAGTMANAANPAVAEIANAAAEIPMNNAQGSNFAGRSQAILASARQITVARASNVYGFTRVAYSV